MSYSELFTIFNTAVLPFWALLVFLPTWKGTNLLVHSGLIPLIYGVAYTALLVQGIVLGGPEGAGFGSIQEVMVGFSVEAGMLAGWIHFLVFDMFVGAWIARDSRRRGIPHLAIIPCLLLTLMFGPLGLLIYVVMRGVWKKTWVLAEAAA